jgi:hypothetical protein
MHRAPVCTVLAIEHLKGGDGRGTYCCGFNPSLVLVSFDIFNFPVSSIYPHCLSMISIF